MTEEYSELDKILVGADYYKVDRDIWCSSELELKSRHGFNFIQMPFVKGIIVFGKNSRHPLIGVDCSLDEHSSIMSKIANIKRYGAVVGEFPSVVEGGENFVYRDFLTSVDTVYSKEGKRLGCMDQKDEDEYKRRK